MTTPGKADGLPSYVKSTVPPSNAPQPAAIPTTLQWNVSPVPAGPNGHPGSPVWNASSAQPQINTSNGVHQGNVQPAPTYFMPTGLPQGPQLEAFHQAFLKGKPLALGVVLIVSSLLQISFAIALPYLHVTSITLYSAVQFWGPIFYITAGSLAIAGYKRPRVSLVKGTLGLSIVSSIFSMFGIMINAADFAFMRLISCYSGRSYYERPPCNIVGGYVIVAFLFVMNLLVFAVTVALSTFANHAVQKAPSSSPPVMFVIQNDVLLSVPPEAYPPQSSDVPNLQPPPYTHQP